MIGLGLFGLAMIFLFQDITVNTENDYYLLKEITESSMLDAVDMSYYSLTGEVKILQEKFVEVFTRRFAQASSLTSQGYVIEFVDIIEEPPKVTVRIRNNTKGYTFDTTNYEFDIINELSAIIETDG